MANSTSERIEVVFVCDKAFEGQARTIMTSSVSMPVTVKTIAAGKLRRYANFGLFDYLTTPSVLLKNATDMLKLAGGTIQSLLILAQFRPDIVFAKGGFVCLPVGWAARLLKVPLVLHDSDARPGLTSKLLAPSAKAIATGYPLKNYPYDVAKTIYTGVPIRDEFVPVSANEQSSLKRSLGIEEQTKLVVSVGGGLGSKIMNTALIGSVERLRASGAQAVLVAGKNHYDSAKKGVEDSGVADTIRVLSFAEPLEIHKLLAAADVVVTRASATFLQELAGLQKAIIAIPARQLSDQHRNAEVYRAAGAAVLLTDDQLEAGELGETLAALLDDSDRRHAMAQALGEFARPDAAKEVSRLLLSVHKQ